MKNILLLLISFTFFSASVFAQSENRPSWISPSREFNFHDIQADFNKYWEGKNITPESPRDSRPGWKQFKRWEWFWEQRVYPTGEFPKRGHVFEEYLKYKANKDNRKDEKVQSADWLHLGPKVAPGGYQGLGRLNCVIEDPNFNGTTNQTIWVGAASGGVWKTTNSGNNWTTNTDEFAVLGVADIVIDPNNSNIMYVATGDGDAYDTYSIGVLKSTDAGQTWNLTGFQRQVTNFIVCRRMIISHGNSNVLFVATNGGLYRTTNAGSNWTQMVSGNFYDVKQHPTNPNIVYASTGNTVHRTVNGGANWSSVNTISGSTRIALAVTPAQPGYLYTLSSNSSGGFNGLRRSIDSGATFTTRATTPNILASNSAGTGTSGQGWFDLALAIDNTNADIVFVGGVNIWKSTNGGTNWSLQTYWTYLSSVPEVHADHHMLYFGNTNRLYSAHDGGLDYTTNSGSTWNYKGSGLHITQIYRISTAQTEPNFVLCGTQDNSTFLRRSNSFGMTRATGDGMDQAINPSNHNIMFTSSYYGNMSRSTNGGLGWASIPKPNDNGAWVTPYVIDPNNHTTLVAGFTKVWRSTNNGTNWTQISNFTNTSSLTSLHVAKNNSNYMYVGRSSAMWRTTNGGTDWSSVTLPTTGLTSITTNHSDENEVWISVSGYTSGSKVFHSTNAGANWTNISGSLPNVPCNRVIFQPNVDNRIWAATDIGVWYRGTTNTDWVDYNDYLPNVVCNDLDIYYAGNKLRVGTYGRGLWEATLPGLANAPPVLVTPDNNANNMPVDVVFQWNSTLNSTAYRLQVSTSSNFNNIVHNSVVASTSDTVNNLNFNTQYYWRVRAKSVTDTSDWSSFRNFTTRIPIYQTELIIPQDMMNINSTSVDFIWNNQDYATTYKIDIAADSLFNSVLSSTNVNDTTFSWLGVQPNSKYYWRVRGENPSFIGQWSESWSFTSYVINIVTVGSDSLSTDVPFHTYYADAATYLLYPSSEIISSGGGGGLITSVAFDVRTVNQLNQAMNGFSIYMQNTTLQTISASISQGWQIAYTTNSFTVSQTGWNEFALTNPFLYDGTKNLLLKVCFNNSTWSANSTVYGTSKPGLVYVRRSDTATDPCNTDPTYVYSQNTRPNIKLTIAPELPPPYQIAPQSNNILNNDTPLFKWSDVEQASMYQLQVYLLSSINNILVNEFTTDTTFQSSPLGYEGQYQWRVRSINGSDTSSWTVQDFIVTRVSVSHKIPLTSGWNMISSYAEPNDLAMSEIFSEQTGNFQIVRNTVGEIFAPPFQNSLQNWNIRQAYQVRMVSSDTLTIDGLRIIPNTTPIVLNRQGWFWIPYLRTTQMPISQALLSISGKYLQVKSINGLVHQPPFIYTLQNLKPGEGYFVRMVATDGVLVYPINTFTKSAAAPPVNIPQPKVFVESCSNTGKNAFFALDISDMQYGDEIAAFTEDGLLVGASVWSEYNKGLVVWGDDEYTNEKDGAAEGEELIVKIWSAEANNIGKVESISLNDMTDNSRQFTLTYETDAVYLLKGTADVAEAAKLSISPQPASYELFVNIPYLQDMEYLNQIASVKLYSQAGQLAIDTEMQASGNVIKLNTSTLSSGVYQMIININGKTYSEKVVIVK